MHGVRVIKLGGEERIINLNNHAIFFLLKELGCELNELDLKITEVCAINPMRGLTYITYAGLLGHLENEAVFIHDITLKAVSTWIGSASDEESLSIWDCFKEVMAIPSASEDQIEAYKKKLDSLKKKNPKVKK